MIKQKFNDLFTSPQLKIGIAVGVSGLSQVILVLAPSSSLSTQEIFGLSLWQVLANGVGIFVSSCVGAIVFSTLVDGGARGISSLEQLASILRNIYKLFLFVIVAVAVAGYFSFNEGRLFLILCLIASLALTLFAAIQRNIYAADGRWGALASQFAIDGCSRTILVLISTTYFSGSIRALLLLSITSQALSIAIPSIRNRWWVGKGVEKESLQILLRKLFPLAVTTSGSLALTTLSPVFMRLAGWSENLVALLAALCIVVRIPSTLVTPLTLPSVRQICMNAASGDLSSVKRRVNIALVPIFAVSATFSISIWFLIYNTSILEAFINGQSNFSFTVMLLSTFVAVLFSVESFLSACINGQGRFFEAGIIYFLASIFWIPFLFLVDEDLVFALELIALGTSIVSLSVYVRLRTRVLSI